MHRYSHSRDCQTMIPDLNCQGSKVLLVPFHSTYWNLYSNEDGIHTQHGLQEHSGNTNARTHTRTHTRTHRERERKRERNGANFHDECHRSIYLYRCIHGIVANSTPSSMSRFEGKTMGNENTKRQSRSFSFFGTLTEQKSFKLHQCPKVTGDRSTDTITNYNPTPTPHSKQMTTVV